MKRFLFCLLFVVGLAHADTTSNLITGTWNNVTNGTHPNNCCTGGPGPLYDSATNTIHFSYGLTAVHQVQAINQALSGSGITINGWNWAYDLRNLNGSGGQNGTDTISVTSFITNSAGQITQQSDQYYSTQFDWTRFSGTETLNTGMGLTDTGSLGIQFVAKDGGFWAGYYGPQVRNVSLSANYTVDPCAANPRYSPSCAGYNEVWSSGNLTSVYGNAFAVNQALGFGNTGVQVHSAIVGFDYQINGQYCSGGWIMGFCMGWSNSKVRGQWNVLDPNNNIIAYDDETISGQNISGTYRNEVLIGRDISTIGNTSITTSRTGNASTSNQYIEFTFRPDICQSDPLINPSCPGYAEAYFSLQCTINALYNASCPGYAVAYYNQQCTINQLYDVGCPGYALAYYNQQCTLDPLYHTGCPGYEQAYYNQQCTINPLYDNGCPGYAEAYYDQQCTLDGLYDTGCPNYATAYYNQQCTLNALYDRQCPGYNEAYAKKQLLDQQNNSNTTTVVTATISPAEVSTTGDATVDKAIKTETASATSTTAVVQLAPSTTQQTATQTAQQEETQQDDMVSENTQQENSASSTQTASSESNGSGGTGGEKTKRQELAAKRAEAKKQAALKAGKAAAEDMGSAKSMEAQVAVQNVVIGAMAFVPGFNAYDFIMPDGLGYKPFQIYKKQVNVDNARLVRGLNGPSERLHTELVNLQYVRD